MGIDFIFSVGRHRYEEVSRLRRGKGNECPWICGYVVLLWQLLFPKCQTEEDAKMTYRHYLSIKAFEIDTGKGCQSSHSARNTRIQYGRNTLLGNAPLATAFEIHESTDKLKMVIDVSHTRRDLVFCHVGDGACSRDTSYPGEHTPTKRRLFGR